MSDILQALSKCWQYTSKQGLIHCLMPLFQQGRWAMKIGSDLSTEPGVIALKKNNEAD